MDQGSPPPPPTGMTDTDMLTERVKLAVQDLHPGDLPLDVSFILGMGFALVLYGVYISVFTLVWMTRKRYSIRNPIVGGVTAILFSLVTALIIVLYIQLFNAFIIYRDTMGPDVWLANFPHPSQQHLTPLRNWLSLFTGVIAQCLIVWRVVVVWRGYRWATIPPVFLLFCAFILSLSAAILTHIASHPPITKEIVDAYNALQVAAPASNLITNVVSTAMIVGRLWWLSHNSSVTSSTKELSNRIIGAIIESGLIFTLCSIARVVLNSKMLKAAFMADAIGIVIDGLAPTLIVLRLNIAASPGSQPSTAVHATFPKSSNSGGGNGSTSAGLRSKFSTKMVFARSQTQNSTSFDTETRCSGTRASHSMDEEKEKIKVSKMVEYRVDDDPISFAPILESQPVDKNNLRY
ncbi:hypothetical protein FRC03_006120 [Tulasnella sp. 419]|nr:hypothetical protein FRC02_003742 [Tulasnella sp. 418]KAG8960797.1 hypothetical protein FRC03_006120 [Tulasnella sp. 419]